MGHSHDYEVEHVFQLVQKKGTEQITKYISDKSTQGIYTDLFKGSMDHGADVLAALNSPITLYECAATCKQNAKIIMHISKQSAVVFQLLWFVKNQTKQCYKSLEYRLKQKHN